MRELAPRIRQLQQDLFKAQMAKDSAETQRIGKELSEASAEFGRLRDSMEGSGGTGGETEQQ